MIPQTGNKQKFLRGFTLLEVMVTTTVLALGATLIYQSFFIAVDSFNYYATLLKVSPWMDEKIWQAQNELKHFGSGATLGGSGRLEVNRKTLNWNLTYNSVGQANSLYAINLELIWQQAGRQARLSKSAYALYLEK